MLDDELLFVYGSLMSGLAAAGMLANATLLGSRKTTPHFSLVTLNGYPGLVSGTVSIHGELYRVAPADWGQLDRYEGVPHLYERHPLELTDGTIAWAYLLTGDYSLASVPIKATDWRRYLTQLDG